MFEVLELCRANVPFLSVDPQICFAQELHDLPEVLGVLFERPAQYYDII